MIQHFRKKFIAFSTAALLLVIITIVGSISGVTYYRSHQEVNSVLEILSDNEGQIPARQVPQQPQTFSQPRFTRESLFQYRYFSVNLAQDTGKMSVDNAHILSVSPTEIKRLTKRVMARRQTQGRILYKRTTYAYQVKKNGNHVMVVFLDESLMMAKAREVTNFGLLLGAISLLLYTIVLVIFSKAAIRPIIQAEERQKEFITNAGHELKTPLSVISANTEMQEMMNGEDELTASTKQQVSRLTKLIGYFVSMARLQEKPTMDLVPINASDVANRVVDSFKNMITSDGKQFKKSVTSNLFVRADEHYFYELISILLDNANKYCDAKGDVFLTLKRGKRKRNAVLTVTNSYADGENVDYNRFFERFYREDKARTVSKKSGYGIGLSMAQNIVKRFGGQISARYANGRISFIVRMRLVDQKEAK